MRWLVAFGFIGCSVPAAIVIVGCENSSGGSSGSIDAGVEVGLPPGTPPPDASPTDGAGPPSGSFVRFAHFSASQKTQDIDFCLAPMGTNTFKLVYTPLGRSLHYGEVGRFIPIEPGQYELRVTSTADCDDQLEENTLLIPSGQAFVRATHATVLSNRGLVVSSQWSDIPASRDPAKDRITLFDATDDRDAGTDLPANWKGSTTTVDIPISNSTRTATALLPAGEQGKHQHHAARRPGHPTCIPHDRRRSRTRRRLWQRRDPCLRLRCADPQHRRREYVQRTLTLGDGVVWSERVLATVYAGGEARTVHWDGEIITWNEARTAPKSILRTNERTDFAVWLDERLVLLVHSSRWLSSDNVELRAFDETEPRWKVARSGYWRAIVVLPCRTMVWLDARPNQQSLLLSLADGSGLEESGYREQWVAIGRYAKYRCVLQEVLGDVIRTWYDAEGTEEVELAPSTHKWRLECDGKTLLEYSSVRGDVLPRSAWFADDDTSVTIVIGDHRSETYSLPDLRPLAKPTTPPKPQPSVVAPVLPAPKRASFADVPEIPSRAGVTKRWKNVELGPEEVFFEHDSELLVSNGDEIRFYDGKPDDKEGEGEDDGYIATLRGRTYIPRRAGSGHNHAIAFGHNPSAGTIALVIENTVHAEPFLRNEWPIGPPTRQLRLFALDDHKNNQEPNLLRILATHDWR